MSSTTRTRRLRSGALGVSAVALALVGLTACGETKPSEAALSAKLKTLSDLQGSSDARISCIAGVIHQYGTAKTLNQFLKDGNPDDIEGNASDVATVKQKVTACSTKYPTTASPSPSDTSTATSPTPSATSS